MRKFQINVVGQDKGHLFDTVSQAYAWVCENVMTEGDVEYYRSIGNIIPLSQIQTKDVQEAVMRNVFENVRFSGWNDRVNPDSPYFIYH